MSELIGQFHDERRAREAWEKRFAELEAENARLRVGLGRIAQPAAGTHDFAALVRIAQSTLAAKAGAETPVHEEKRDA